MYALYIPHTSSTYISEYSSESSFIDSMRVLASANDQFSDIEVSDIDTASEVWGYDSHSYKIFDSIEEMKKWGREYNGHKSSEIQKIISDENIKYMG